MEADQHYDLRGAIASTLDWWRDAGVDCLVGDAPRDWLAPAVATPVAVGVVAEPNTPALPATLPEYLAWRSGDEAIERRWGQVPLAPEGNPGARVHVVVDVPDEDAAYLGAAAGRLFDRMLAAIGLDRAAVCISGLAWARPSGALTTKAESELAAQALHFLALAGPKRVLLLGQTTSRVLLGTDAARKRGHLHGINHSGSKLDIVASWHPRFLLDHPAAKAEAWRDLQLLIGGMSL